MSPRLPLKPLSLQALVAAYESAKGSPGWVAASSVRKENPAAVWNALVVRGLVTLTADGLFVTPLGRLVVEAQGYIAETLVAGVATQIVSMSQSLAPQMGLAPIDVANAVIAEYERLLVERVERDLAAQ